jgi:hypothetical protein
MRQQELTLRTTKTCRRAIPARPEGCLAKPRQALYKALRLLTQGSLDLTYKGAGDQDPLHRKMLYGRTFGTEPLAPERERGLKVLWAKAR